MLLCYRHVLIVALSGLSHHPKRAHDEAYTPEILEQPMKRLYCKGMAELSRLPRPVADEWEWQYEGACRNLPAEMFFHPDGERGPRRRNRENTAKAICASCPVMLACRAHALAVQEPYGIWGGLSEDDRLSIITRNEDPDISHAS
jgi:WhiB family redox-sensing transcriptional regulator